jgi:hypothetical protein
MNVKKLCYVVMMVQEVRANSQHNRKNRIIISSMKLLYVL